MAKRTLKSCWKQYEKLSRQYLDTPDRRDEYLAKLEELTFKANADDIGAALAALFIQPTVGEEVSVQFSVGIEDDGELPDWHTKHDPEQNVVYVHPITIVKFLRDVADMEVTEDMYEDFLRCRYNSFVKEMGKLPSIMVLFLLILQRVAFMVEIAHLEKRGGVVEVAEGEPYHTMLWAFKELEAFARRTYGINARAHFKISWYEADWITGR
jgi:hypothetical protein